MKVYVIIVNWNGQKLLPDCLSSLQKQSYSNFKIVVVDNGSTDESINLVKTHFSDVHLISLPQNLGFGKSNNIGIKWALEQGAEAIALLNNDCTATPDWLSHLVQGLSQDSSIGACASQLLFKNNPSKVNGIGIEMDELGYTGDNYCDTDFNPHRLPEETIGFTAGACLIRREALQKAGLFDESYFMYVEDVDLSLRIWQSGFKIVTVPQAIVFHLHNATIKQFLHKKHYFTVRNHLYFSAKFFSFPQCLGVLALITYLRIIKSKKLLYRRQWKLALYYYMGLWAAIMQLPSVLFKKQSYRIDPRLREKMKKNKSWSKSCWNLMAVKKRLIESYGRREGD